MFQTPHTVFKSSKWNLIHMIPIKSRCAWHICCEAHQRCLRVMPLFRNSHISIFVSQPTFIVFKSFKWLLMVKLSYLLWQSRDRGVYSLQSMKAQFFCRSYSAYHSVLTSFLHPYFPEVHRVLSCRQPGVRPDSASWFATSTKTLTLTVFAIVNYQVNNVHIGLCLNDWKQICQFQDFSFCLRKISNLNNGLSKMSLSKKKTLKLVLFLRYWMKIIQKLKIVWLNIAI